MRGKKYPLEPLRRLKKERAEGKTRELGAAALARQGAERAREASEGELEAARARAGRTRDEERAALEDGKLFARDLARAGAWEQRVAIDDRERARAVDRARSAEAEAQSAETRARDEVTVARTEAEVISRHEEGWRSATRRAEEAREEEELAETVRPRRGK